MKKTERILAALDRRHAAEKRRISLALRRLPRRGPVPVSRALDVAQEIILAGDRTLRKRESDDRTERARRILVGARVPLGKAWFYRNCADYLGVSMYRFVCNALEAYAETVTRGLDNAEP